MSSGRLLPREGFTLEPLMTVIQRTLLNPALTLPIYLAPYFSDRAKLVSLIFRKSYSRLRLLLILGLLRWANGILNWGVLNNWKNDRYHWAREIVVITGGSNGFGALVAQGLAKRGIRVVVLDLQPLSWTGTPNVSYFKTDLSSYESTHAAAQAVIAQVGSPTILINNAGVPHGKTILDTTPQELDFTFTVNTFSHYWLVKEFLPQMVRNNHGMVVTVASVAAYLSIPNMVTYNSSKAAALSFHEGLTSELKTRYKAPLVRTVVVTPNYIKTPLFQGFRNDSTFLLPSLEPETVAEAIIDQVLSGTSGHLVLPKGGNITTLLRALPHWLQVSVRADAQKIMANYRGREFVNPNSREKGGDQGSIASLNPASAPAIVPTPVAQAVTPGTGNAGAVPASKSEM